MKKVCICWALGLFLFFLLAACIIFYASEETKKAEARKATYASAGVRQEITGVVFTDYALGKKKIEVKAEKITIRPKRIGFFKTPLIKEAHMIKPEISFFTEGKEASHITADSGKMNMGNRRMLLKDSVILTTRDGKRLTTEEMALDPKLGLLSIRGKFVLDKNGDVIKGRGLRSDIGLENLKRH